MSAAADENAQRDLLADLATDSGDSAAHVLWPADPEQEESAGQLWIDLDDGRTWPGSPVTVEARVTAPGRQEVRAVIRVQGLEPAWCPQPQVVAVSAGATARLFVELSPAAGTPPGRYLWSLIAEVQNRPMLVTTAQLHVERATPAAPAPPRRSGRHPLALLALVLTVLLVTLAALAVLAPSGFWGRDRAPRPSPSATGPGHLLPTAGPSGTPAAPRPEMVLVKGTVLAPAGKEPIRITVVRLNLDDLSGSRPTPTGPVPEAMVVDKQVRGKHWSLSLPPGVYGLTFSKPQYVSESIVVATAVAGTIARPHVRLDRIAPSPTGPTAG